MTYKNKLKLNSSDRVRRLDGQEAYCGSMCSKPPTDESSSCELSDTNVRSHVQARKLVHVSGVHGRASGYRIVMSRVLRSKRKSSGDVAGTAKKQRLVIICQKASAPPVKADTTPTITSHFQCARSKYNNQKKQK